MNWKTARCREAPNFLAFHKVPKMYFLGIPSCHKLSIAGCAEQIAGERATHSPFLPVEAKELTLGKLDARDADDFLAAGRKEHRIEAVWPATVNGADFCSAARIQHQNP